MRLIHPLTRRGVALLARTPVEPWQVVVAHSLIGLLAALLISADARAAWVGAALLLQMKTLLDNLDGGLARATNRVTELGRYLDTGLDLIVNFAIFAALAVHGPLALAALGFVILTVVLSCDFNAERLYRDAHGDARSDVPTVGRGGGTSTVAQAPVPEPRTLALRLFSSLYRLLLAPQDRYLSALDGRLFHRAAGVSYLSATTAQRRSWSDLFSTAALVNLGLSSQFVALGACLLLGRPFLYVYLVLLQGIYVAFVQYLRVMRFRRSAGPTTQPDSSTPSRPAPQGRR